MFYDGGYMGGMHGFWWLFWLMVIGVVLFNGWGRRGGRSDHPRGSKAEASAKELEEKVIKTIENGLNSGQ